MGRRDGGGGGRLALIVFAIFLLAFYSLGFLSLGFLLAPFLPLIVISVTLLLPWLAGYWWILPAGIGILAVMGFVLGYLILVLMRRAAAAVLMVAMVIQSLMLVAGGVFLAISSGGLWLMGAVVAGLGGLELLILIAFRGRVRRAGQLAQLTAQLVLEEKEMFLPPLVTAIFGLLTGILMVGTMASLYLILVTAGISTDSLPALGLGIVLEAAYIFTYYAVFYLMEGINVAVAGTWYRGEDPTLAGAAGQVARVSGTIIAFSFIRTLVALLQRLLRRGGRQAGGVAGTAGRVAARAIGGVFTFINYFTLPAIVLERRGLGGAIKRSVKVVWHHLIDVYLSETGVTFVFALFGLLFFLGFGAIGMAVGFTAGLITTADPNLSLMLGILMAILFALFAAVPAYFIFRPLGTSYRTILFCYAVDEERGKRSRRLPAEYRQAFRDVKREWETGPGKRKAPAPPSSWS